MKPYILISNDDGYQSKGLIALADNLRQWANIVVVAPEINHSGASNSLTLNRPLELHQVESDTFYVTGTPSDCVHIAMTSDLFQKPDLVISGINNGANMGDDTHYSGTIAAATEGFLFGVPSIAFSLTQRGWECLDSAAHFASLLTRYIVEHPEFHWHALLNVNIPPVNGLTLKDVLFTRLGKRHQSEPVIEQKNPKGESVYWIGPAGAPRDMAQGTDFYAVKQGKVSITPLQFDFTDVQALERMAQFYSHFTE